jgi:hypothetical protein
MHGARTRIWKRLKAAKPFFAILIVAPGSVRAISPDPAVMLPETAPAPAPALPADSSNGDEGSKPQWQMVYRVSTAITYDDNIYISPDDRKADWSLDVAPALAVGWGHFRSELSQFAEIPHLLVQTGEEDLPRQNFLFASYEPDAVIYATQRHADALNHKLRVAGQADAGRTTVRANLQFQRTTAPDIDVGGRVTTTLYSADAAADYALTGKLTGGIEGQASRTDTDPGLWSEDAHATVSLDDALAPKTTLGLGVTDGRLLLQRGASQSYWQPLLRAQYLATEKLSVDGWAGEEFRSYDSAVSSRSRPVFRVNGHYAPAADTVLAVGAERKTDASAAYADEDMLETIWEGTVRQRIGHRLYLSVAGGLTQVDYESDGPVAAVIRRDNYYFYRPALSRDLTDHGSIELSVEHRRDNSSLSNFRFEQNIFRLSSTWLF